MPCSNNLYPAYSICLHVQYVQCLFSQLTYLELMQFALCQNLCRMTQWVSLGQMPFLLPSWQCQINKGIQYAKQTLQCLQVTVWLEWFRACWQFNHTVAPRMCVLRNMLTLHVYIVPQWMKLVKPRAHTVTCYITINGNVTRLKAWTTVNYCDLLGSADSAASSSRSQNLLLLDGSPSRPL